MGFGGFIKKAKGAVGSVESMASDIGSSFKDAATSRKIVSPPSSFREAGSRLKQAASDTYEHPLFKIGPVTVLPAPKTVTGNVGRAARNPTPSNLFSAASNVADYALLGSGEGTAGKIATGARRLDLSSELGAVGGKPGFMRSAEEVFKANRATARAGDLAEAAGETAGAASRAVKAAKQLVNPETNLVMTRAERAGSGLVEGAAASAKPVKTAVDVESTTNHAAQLAEDAASAAKASAKTAVEETPRPAGRVGRFTSYVKGKATGTAKGLVTSPVRSARSAGRAAGEAVQAVTHPGLISTPAHLAKAGLKAGEALAEAIPAAAVIGGGVGVYAAHNRPSASDATDSAAAKRMGMSVEDFRGIQAVQAKYGAAGLKALTTGLAKAEKTGLLSGLTKASKQPGKGGKLSKQAKNTLLRASVATSFKPSK